MPRLVRDLDRQTRLSGLAWSLMTTSLVASGGTAFCDFVLFACEGGGSRGVTAGISLPLPDSCEALRRRTF